MMFLLKKYSERIIADIFWKCKGRYRKLKNWREYGYLQRFRECGKIIHHFKQRRMISG